VALLVACAQITPHRLVGEWRYADARQSCRYVFADNGSFTGEVTFQGKTVSRFRGRWGLTGHVLSYEYQSDLLGRIPPGTVDHDELLRVDRDAFLIRAADGSERRYLRIR
jgi:hypothetical protein